MAERRVRGANRNIHVDAISLPAWDKEGPLVVATAYAMSKKGKKGRKRTKSKLNEKKFKKALASCDYAVNSGANSRVCLWRGDITKLKIDAITNAANTGLLDGGGICGAIFKAAGLGELAKACARLGNCDTGDAVVTPAFKLPCKRIVHAVGPRGDKPDLLASAYRATLSRCVEHGLRSVALCCISTGAAGFSQEEAAVLALKTVRAFLLSKEGKALDRVVFCLFRPSDLELYQRACPVVFPLEPAERAPASAADVCATTAARAGHSDSSATLHGRESKHNNESKEDKEEKEINTGK